MDQRTRNRIAEHSRPGHTMSPATIETLRVDRPGQKLFQCTCGWLGWLHTSESEET